MFHSDTIPSLLELERAVLGALLNHSDTFEKISDEITTSDFYAEAPHKQWRKGAALRTRNVLGLR